MRSKLDGMTTEQRAHVGGMCYAAGTLAADDEREACAKIADDMAGDLIESLEFDPGPYTAEQVLNGYRMIAKLIRNRKPK